MPIFSQEQASQLEQKAIEPEILNRHFMTTEDYLHYSDWKTELEQTYDQFNLLQMPPRNAK
jgi:hypothetical protein